MSNTNYNSGPTSNDLLIRLIAKQAALNHKIIVQNADAVLNDHKVRLSRSLGHQRRPCEIDDTSMRSA